MTEEQRWCGLGGRIAAVLGQGLQLYVSLNTKGCEEMRGDQILLEVKSNNYLTQSQSL